MREGISWGSEHNLDKPQIKWLLVKSYRSYGKYHSKWCLLNYFTKHDTYNRTEGVVLYVL